MTLSPSPTCPPTLRAALRHAAAHGLPYALWRRPGAAGGAEAYEAAIALTGLAARPLFAPDAPSAQPGFAITRFDVPDPAEADVIPADVRIRGGAVDFYAGGGAAAEFASRPATPAQQAFLDAIAEAAEGAEGAAGNGSGAALPLRAETVPAPTQMTETQYQALVRSAVDAIEGGAFLKAVTSRAEARPLGPDHDILAIFAALAERHPSAFVALFSAPGLGVWITATPETLLTVADGVVHTMALAGTQWSEPGAGAIADLGAVLWPDKIIEEQAIVARDIRASFAAAGFDAVDEFGPRTTAAGPLVHLRSRFEARLGAANPNASLQALLRALHPTSAVCGMPKRAALEFLRAHEGYDRRYYTGYLGPIGFDGRSDLFVNLRSAQISGAAAYLYVGGGIVAGSTPETEWAETMAKTRTIGSALPTAEG